MNGGPHIISSSLLRFFDFFFLLLTGSSASASRSSAQSSSIDMIAVYRISLFISPDCNEMPSQVIWLEQRQAGFHLKDKQGNQVVRQDGTGRTDVQLTLKYLENNSGLI